MEPELRILEMNVTLKGVKGAHCHCRHPLPLPRACVQVSIQRDIVQNVVTSIYIHTYSV